MNIAESMKHVLKSKSQNIFTDFWKEDLTQVLKEFMKDLSHLTKSSGSWFGALKDRGLKSSLQEVKESAVDTFLIFKIIPRRIKFGFTYFKEELLQELDNLIDPKQRALFCVKIIGALSGFTINAIYGIKKNNSGDFKFKGLRLKNAFTQFIVMELVVRITKVFVTRFLNEVEKELTEADDLKNVRYFKNLLDSSDPQAVDKVVFEPGDRALQIVENLRNYILTGKKSGE